MNKYLRLMVTMTLAVCLYGAKLQAAATTLPATIITPETVFKSTTVSLHFKQAGPQVVFAELSRQAGREISPYPPNMWARKRWPVIDVDLNNVSFWTAMKELCRRYDLTAQRLGVQRELVLMADSSGAFWRYPSIEYGPFLLVATDIERTDQIDLTVSPQAKRQCLVRLRVYAEPKVPMLKTAATALMEEAVDETGQSLCKPGIDPQLHDTTGEVGTVAVPLYPPDGAGRRMTHMRGQVRVLVQTKAQVVEIDNLLAATGATLQVPGRRLTLLEANNDAEIYSARVMISRLGEGSSDWADVNLNSTFRMLDAQGKPLIRRVQAGGEKDGRVSVNLAFAREDGTGAPSAGQAQKLIWEAPLETRQVWIPFDFTTLTMP